MHFKRLLAQKDISISPTSLTSAAVSTTNLNMCRPSIGVSGTKW